MEQNEEIKAQVLNGEFRPKWRNRRRLIFVSLTFCSVVLSFLTAAAIAGISNALSITIAGGVIAYATAVVGSYVFGARWSDKDVMENIARIVSK